MTLKLNYYYYKYIYSYQLPIAVICLNDSVNHKTLQKAFQLLYNRCKTSHSKRKNVAQAIPTICIIAARRAIL